MIRYQRLASMLRQIIQNKTQLKTVLYSGGLSIGVASAYSLLSTIINNLPQFRKSLKQIQQITNQTISNQYLFFVLVGQLNNVGKIQGGGKLKRIITTYKHLLPNIQKQSKINKKSVQIRLRENTQQYNYWKSIFYVEKMPIIKNIYNFKAKQYSDIVNSNQLILKGVGCVVQSYSSALPAYLLMSGLRWGQQSENISKFDIIDACAAPGNKTLQLCEYLGKNGSVFAFEKNEKRFNILNDNLKRYKVENSVCKHMDFLSTNPEQYKKVKLVLLDPSCSGSGMLTNILRDKAKNNNDNKHLSINFEDYCKKQYDQLEPKEKQRVSKLHDFQLSLLRHAAKFRPLRLSYSTCSIYQKENEQVIKEFLQKQPEYSIKKNKEAIQCGIIEKGFGKGMENCIRVDPRNKTSDGFFVCILKRNKSNN